MKFKQVSVVVLLVMTMVLMASAILAQEPVPFDSPVPPEEWPPVPDVDVGDLSDYVSAVGLGAVITVMIEILKRLQVIPDGAAGRWATIANIVVFAGLVLAGVFGVDYTGDEAKAIFDLLHRIGQAILTIITSPIFFKILREANVLPILSGRQEQ